MSIDGQTVRLGSKDDNRDFSAFEVFLVFNALVYCEENVEFFGFRRR